MNYTKIFEKAFLEVQDFDPYIIGWEGEGDIFKISYSMNNPYTDEDNNKTVLEDVYMIWGIYNINNHIYTLKGYVYDEEEEYLAEAHLKYVDKLDNLDGSNK